MKRPRLRSRPLRADGDGPGQRQAREIAPQWDRSADEHRAVGRRQDASTRTAQELGQHPLFAVVDRQRRGRASVVGEGSISAFDARRPDAGVHRATRSRAATSCSPPAPTATRRCARSRRAPARCCQDVRVRRLRAVQVQGLEQRHRARLRGQAVELRRRQEVSGRLPDPRRPAGQLRQRLELSLEPADLRGPGLRGGDDRLPRLHRLRPGLHRRDQPALGRPPAGGPAEGLGRGAAEVRLPRRRQGLRAGRALRRLHGQLDRRQLERVRGSAWSTTTACSTSA